jgi:PilZ domain
MEQERRSVPRYSFSALAEIIQNSGREIRARVTDISVSGCHLISDGRLVVGAEVTLKIRTATDYFQTWAMVVYSTPRDMGLVFHSTAPPLVRVLHKWTGAARMAAATVVNNT